MRLFSSTAQIRARRGFTLTEMAIVLAAMGLVMGGIWAVVSVVWNNFQGQRASQQTISVAQNIRDYYVNSGKMNCATNNDITSTVNDDARRLIPAEMRSKPSDMTSPILHALGGSFSVTCLTNGTAFRLSLGGLKQSDCARLLSDFPVLTPELGVFRMGVKGSSDTGTIDVTNIQSPTTNGSLPMSAKVAVQWCAEKHKNTNVIEVDFKLRN